MRRGTSRFTACERVDYYLVAETPDGHSRPHIVHAEELPDNLPADVPAAAVVRKLYRRRRIVPTCRPHRGERRRTGRVGTN